MMEGQTVPRYPQLRVALRSRNPFAYVSAVRSALRWAGTDPVEIERFSEEALAADDPQRLRQLCRTWVQID
jgi:hypothetical protein